MLLFLALQAATPAADALPPGIWARIGRSAALRQDRLTLDMRSTYDGAAKRQEHHFRLERRRGGEPVVFLRASSRTCPAVREVASFSGLPMPEPQTPEDALVIVMDGVGYSVTLPVGYAGQASGTVTLSSNTKTPLARWVDGALAKLERCWSPE